MLAIKELQLLTMAIDNIDIDKECYLENKESLQKVRAKISDMITLQYAWNREKRIEIREDILI